MIDGLLQPTHLALVLVIALIVFGPGKIGEIGGQLGRGVREFRTTLDNGAHESAGSHFCSTCGTPLPPGQFCPSCGAQQTGLTTKN